MNANIPQYSHLLCLCCGITSSFDPLLLGMTPLRSFPQPIVDQFACEFVHGYRYVTKVVTIGEFACKFTTTSELTLFCGLTPLTCELAFETIFKAIHWNFFCDNLPHYVLN
jgi:hypothetical protein